jgi:hypothetical protein
MDLDQQEIKCTEYRLKAVDFDPSKTEDVG